jgi:hypothetical protein
MHGVSIIEGQERRRRIRFPIAFNATYAVVGRERLEGTCKAVNISSHGMLATFTPEVTPGTSIRVVIEWPILNGSVCPLGLHILGTVARCDRGLAAVRFSTHELRTERKPSIRQGQRVLKLPVR